MLQSVTLTDFRSYRNGTLPLAPLTVMIGANASGKSNAIEALRLLSWIAQGNRLGAIRYAVYEAEQLVRGTPHSLARESCTKFSLACSTDISEWDKYSITVSIKDDDDLHISDERIYGDHSTVPLFEVVGRSEGAGNDLRVAYNNFARGGRKPQVTCNDQITIAQQLQSSARFEVGHKSAQREIPVICGKYLFTLANILFLDPQPASMRGYSFMTEHRLLGDGSNLSGVLFNLCEKKEDEQAVLDLVKSLPEQHIDSISFIKTPRNECMLEVKETFGQEHQTFDATLLSDGTLRVLSIAAAILSAPEGSLVVIEEIDNGVHPSRARMILEKVSSIAKERSLHVLISSHNPALLDALPDDAVPHVVFCYRDPKDGSSRLIELQKIPDYPELLAQGSVGDLMTRGVIEKFVKNHPGPDEKKRMALSWLESLRSA